MIPKWTQAGLHSYDLQRFLDVQAGGYERVVEELRAGRKQGHWMWYVFPQMRGLGHSAMSQRFAISSRGEAKAFAEHPVLGLRLRECTQLVLDIEGKDIGVIFGWPDELKFRSCMTLFSMCAEQGDLFEAALEKYYDGKPDQATLRLLSCL